ncbi:MAG: LysM peptidoglycan-binding domain-containing protein [Chloroflexi bacterium]|nr:LysM peptidoglycan-binding domain-containing protein [Chloroflexota bacterium]
MSDENEGLVSQPVVRCPRCDSVVAFEATVCLMCGAAIPPQLAAQTAAQTAVADTPPAVPISTPAGKQTAVEPAPPVPETAVSTPASIPDVFESVVRERQSSMVFWLTAVFAVIIVVMGSLFWQYRDPNLILALVPTTTPIPPTPSHTPTWTPLPTETLPPSATPTITLTPAPTETPQPPRQHTVTSGDTLFGLALQYRVSAQAIAEANGFAPESPILSGQALQIPWPTPTPPLIPVGVDVNGDLVIADPTNCQRYQVVSGDSLSAISARFDVDYDLFLLVNRLTSDSVMQPGDTVCIPTIIYNATLPPTPGPSPTPSLTPAPAGPRLLYPIQYATINPPDGLVTLQWVAVKDLADDEWYMVELTDLDALDSAPYRGFTRDNAFQVPSSWRPPVAEPHQLRWRVSIIRVTDWREDGLPIYTFGGQSSQDAFFTWEGAVPTPTPTLTPTATPLPTATP